MAGIATVEASSDVPWMQSLVAGMSAEHLSCLRRVLVVWDDSVWFVVAGDWIYCFGKVVRWLLQQ